MDGALDRASIDSSHRLWATDPSPFDGAQCHVFGLKEFYQLALPQSKKIEHALGMGLG